MCEGLVIFRKNLNTYMEKYDMNQTMLADRIGVTSATISKWVLGKSEPSFKYMDKLCAVFHCTRSELVEVEQTPQSIDESAKRKRLLSYFERLTPEGTSKVIDYMEDLNEKYLR